MICLEGTSINNKVSIILVQSRPNQYQILADVITIDNVHSLGSGSIHYLCYNTSTNYLVKEN